EIVRGRSSAVRGALQFPHLVFERPAADFISGLALHHDQFRQGLTGDDRLQRGVLDFPEAAQSDTRQLFEIAKVRSLAPESKGIKRLAALEAAVADSVSAGLVDVGEPGSSFLEIVERANGQPGRKKRKDAIDRSLAEIGARLYRCG